MTGGDDAGRIGVRALATGTVATAILHASLGLAAEADGAAPLRPLNASSHWLNGTSAARFGGVDLARTGTGAATNLAACIVWASCFETWQDRWPPQSGTHALRDALVMAAVAAAVDYGATPKRFTPGWEHVLSRSGMVAAYAALALGFAAGSSLSRSIARL